MRNWSSEGVRGNTPTHVSVYDASKIAAGVSGLDREGMALVALMSGGDYIPAGVPGCGIKVACEAARAGFGKSLFSLSKADTAGFKAWRDRLAHELHSNESKFFRVKHKSFQLPETFPNQEVLGYYTNPVVSSPERVERFKNELRWEQEIDITGLRVFVADAFDWHYKSGAKKFIRGG
jgi:Holliday junction resolvase YEN1